MNYQKVLASLPALDQAAAQQLLDEAVARSRHKIIVLDDDPTGTQTVHDVAVLTGWDANAIQAELEKPARLFYILTNSRGLTRDKTIVLHTDIACNIHKAAKALNVQVLIVCRGDSTLRGHYPHETQAIREQLERLEEKPIDGEILCPYFKEGGRLTLYDTHYVQDGEHFVPVNETEFAKDRTFTYKNANLPAWVQEKTGGAFTENQVSSIQLEELRLMDMAVIKSKLKALTGFQEALAQTAFDAPADFERVLLLASRRMRRTGATLAYTSRLTPRVADALIALSRMGPRTALTLVTDGELTHEQQKLLHLLQNSGVSARHVRCL